MALFTPIKFAGSVLATALFALAGLPAVAQSTTNLRVLTLGDSITAGYLSSTGNGYRGPLWTALTSQVATQDFVGNRLGGTMSDPVHNGRYGWRIDQIAGIATGVLNTYLPNIVLLDIGINDLNQNYEVSTAPTRLGSLIDQINTAEPDATVLVAQLIVNANATTESEVVTFNAALPAIVATRANAGKHVYLVNMSALTTADLSDGLHPNDTGYQLMANAWDSAIQTVIGKGWITYPLAGSATRPVGSIYSGVAGKCLDDLNDSGVAETAAVSSDCNGSAEQQFEINTGSIAINGLCLDVVGAGTAIGTKVDLFGCSYAANQMWTPQANGSLLNPVSGLCLDLPNSNTTNGTQLQIYTCNGGANQQWQLPAEGSITSGISGKCLDALGGSNANGTKGVISSCNSSAEQQLKVFTDSIRFNGACLDVKANGTTNGSLVQLYTCNGGANQVWQFKNGTVVNPVSGRCLDDPGSSTTNGTQLDIWDCTGGTNQQWTMPPM